MYGFQVRRAAISRLRVAISISAGVGGAAVELVPLRDGLRIVHRHGEELRRRVIEDVEDLALSPA